MKALLVIIFQLVLEIVQKLPLKDWFTKTPEEKIKEGQDQVNEDMAHERESGRPGPGGVMTVILLVGIGCSTMGVQRCEDPISPESEQYMVDTALAQCSFAPILHSSFGPDSDISVMDADGFYCQSQIVEAIKRKKYLELKIRLENCEQGRNK